MILFGVVGAVVLIVVIGIIFVVGLNTNNNSSDVDPSEFALESNIPKKSTKSGGKFLYRI